MGVRIALTHLRQAAVGGTEQVLNLLARHLCERGHEVAIVCRSHEQAPHPPPHPAVRFVELKRPVVGAAWRMRAFATDVARHVAETRYDVVMGLGKTWSQDVVRTGGGSHAAYLELARPHEPARLASSRLRDRVALGIERRALAPGAYRRVIANSKLVQRDLVGRYAVPPAAIEVIYNGVDLERFGLHQRGAGRALRAELGLAADQPVVAFVGGGFGRKGLGRLIAALPEVLRAHPRLVLLIAGRDSAQRVFERQADQLGVAHALCFLGRRTDPEACYTAADLYCLPTWYDSFGFSVLEALASGLPVITTELAGASELVDDGVHGAVLPGPAGPVELAAALLRWLEPERRASAAALARARAEEHDVRRSLERIEATLVATAAEKTGNPEDGGK
jgi:UDP-glucose:(heptosyl)LPS alpha-1,3-glucosyltransferase